MFYVSLQHVLEISYSLTRSS